MNDSFIWENGNRKVVGEAWIIGGVVHNSLTFYEDDREVVFAVLHKKKFLEFDSKQFKQLSGYSFINTFLEQGIEKITIRNILTCFKNETGRARWNIVISLKNGMEYEYLGASCCSERLFFPFKDEVCSATLLSQSRNVTYHELSDLTINDILGCSVSVYIPQLEISSHWKIGKFCFEDYGFEIPTYYDVFNRITDIKNLKRMDYFNTGHLFKITDDTKKELAKRKLLTGQEVPMLLAIDSNGYGIFDGIPYMN